ncbi:hypothetical protein E4U43_002755 [Claviceps pusilla]|uniref:Transport protein USO1 n=1 Tax=Claviceps pusilla TaxID=123648 RepID=A0A9P7NGY5_9HYPO|nr:hypothetical protein E4U43_002755 [Claviceps pusilla]
MFSIATTPAKQSVSETITVLSGRLNSAVLLEDRRAAISGLRSFAKNFPASVASGALRCLIGSLSKDGDDVDTVKVTLETLLLLFNPNQDSPEASDEVLLWLADEFTQRQENITLLLDFVESSDFYSRLYSLQLLSAILSARTERTEECIFTAPLGISRLVAALADEREAVRDECIGLLISLTPTSRELQKLVAFENAFERIFAIMAMDGSLSNGGRTVEDCLILLANLLRRNVSNQSLFRESGCISSLASLLDGLLRSESSGEDVAIWAQTQCDRNIYAFLAVLRLFFIPGLTGISINQETFWNHGLVYNTLQLAFSRMGQIAIRSEALTTCGDMIRGSKSLQESFAQLTIPAPLPTDDVTEGTHIEYSAKIYVIDGLLDLTLNSCDPQLFDLRYSACECLKAYFSGHSEVRLHFLSRAIQGYASGADESANILAVLLRPDPTKYARDPYRQWFASVIAFHLLHDNPTAKTVLLGVTEGDASKDEELVTSIQTITAHLISGISRGDDARVLVGYLMLLLSWTFEDVDAVNDFLAEGSNVQSLIQAILHPSVPEGEIVQGLCALLLGVAYEFSTKDSPLSRSNLYSILIERLDREQYLDCLNRLRIHPLIRDFEVTSQKCGFSKISGLPDIFFDAEFVNFVKDNYSRIKRSIDRSPELEISIVTNGIQKGISRELVDSLRRQVEDKQRALEELQDKIASLEDALRHREESNQLTIDELKIELTGLKTALENAEKVHEEKIRTMLQQQVATEQEQRRQAALVDAQITARETKFQKELIQAQKAALSEIERIQLRADAEEADLKASINRLEIDLMKASRNTTLEIQRLQEQNDKLLTAEVDKRKEAEAMSECFKEQLREMKAQVEEMREKASTAEAKLSHELATKQTAQAELDDLLIVFGDLEEKVAKYKIRLRELGQDVSEGEDEGNGEGEDEI